MNAMVYQLPQLFPTAMHRNLGISSSTDHRKAYSPLLTEHVCDLTFTAACQVFPLFTWEKVESAPDGLDLFGAAAADSTADYDPSVPLDFSRPIAEQVPEQLDGYVRRDNITDATLQAYRQHYGDQSISKEDVFFYV